MELKELLKELLYKWVEKIVEDLEKLTTNEQKEEIKIKQELPPVEIETIHTMPSFKETSGEVWYKVKKMVEISKDEMERMRNKLQKVELEPPEIIRLDTSKKWKEIKNLEEEQREKKNAYNREYYQKNKEKCKEWARKAYEKKKQKEQQEQKEMELKFNKAWEFSNNYSLLP